jgi:prepilin-type N-terminal cleavage/methylation domain-containing protein
MRNGLRTQVGYSLIELMLVLGIMGIVTGIAVVQIGSSRQGLTGDGAMRVVLSQLNQAKELAITQRRNMRVTFTNTSVQIVREEVPGPALFAMPAVPFEGGMQFLRITSLGDPELAALPSTSATAFGPNTTQVRFAPDGTLVDQDGLTLNGTLFLARPAPTNPPTPRDAASQAMSARAVTIFGSTGRIRGFRWSGNSWKVV